jgi:hypothetical protein
MSMNRDHDAAEYHQLIDSLHCLLYAVALPALRRGVYSKAAPRGS